MTEPIGRDDSGHASMARYSYATAGEWCVRYNLTAFMWQVPPDARREHYGDIYALSFVKGCEGEVADISLSL